MGCCDSEDKENTEETEERSCTDVFWLILYILFWFLMVIIAAFSFVYGNPLRIINGYDSFGNICGTKNNKPMGNFTWSGLDTSDKPYLLFYDIKNLKDSLKICVKSCPAKTLLHVKDIYDYHQGGMDLCKYGFNYEELKNPDKDKSVLSAPLGPCPVLPIYEGKPVLNRCIPQLFKEGAEAILSNFYDLLNGWDTLDQVLGDVYHTWREILLLSVLSLLISLVTIAILHCLAHIISYFIMIGFALASIGGTAYLWYTYIDIKRNLDHTELNAKYSVLVESVRNETAFLWFSIIATIITIVILAITVFMRKQVDFLANLFKETSKCIMHLPGLFFQPLLTFIFLAVFFLFWIFVVLCLATASNPSTHVISGVRVEGKGPIATVPPTINPNNVSMSVVEKLNHFKVVEYIDADWIQGMWWVYFIGLIWTSEFIMACQQMVIAGAVAHWFYRHKYKSNDHVCYSMGKLLKYHLGSVALGSLIITAFKIPRLILMYLHERFTRGKEKGNECSSCGLKCCICCFYCLEKFIRYLNHNAYTVIAIDGSNFCKAAGTAFEVLTSHALQVATINSLGDFILFLGKCFVTAVTGIIGLAIFRRNPELTFYAAPTLLVCIFAFFVAHCVLSLYEMVLDTVYLCMCQSGDAPDGIQMQNLGVTNNGNTQPQNTELEPMN
ncbi:choline transporter-like 1 [Anthonomus grandis grandis]|uniref:choline transporter-like 1 n=1 Tax=Anthonomus grandis grandis TaxID=2921223 RepID=UPI0021667E34|nr:choline transporter-like 1 [Anthonomus grandis grandis]